MIYSWIPTVILSVPTVNKVRGPSIADQPIADPVVKTTNCQMLSISGGMHLGGRMVGQGLVQSLMVIEVKVACEAVLRLRH